MIELYLFIVQMLYYTTLLIRRFQNMRIIRPFELDGSFASFQGSDDAAGFCAAVVSDEIFRIRSTLMLRMVQTISMIRMVRIYMG